jgi:signal transduction histidine kinase
MRVLLVEDYLPIQNSVVKGLREAGHIEVVAKQLGKSTELTITNTGCLLSQDDARHVFERFWRGDASRSDTGIHCGLGLALVQRAAASIGGTVSASVADGTFTVRLILPATPVA